MCPRGDLNPHALIRALAPQASASTYSATRTWVSRQRRKPGNSSKVALPCDNATGQDGVMSSYRPEEDVVEICRDLIRIDSTNYGDGSGPGEREAAEYVAAKLADVGIESELFEPAKGRTSLVARWGDLEGGDRLLVHGHLDVVPAAKQDWKIDPFAGEVADDYLWGRGAVDMKDFDAAILSVVRARTRAGELPKRPVTLV